eukprot:gb/GFBE01048115.1/.p1 GENE.gb/GFBE01048115.1/~~gb/GFBE01048115.1/.p1  ORF type:complete len:665 (+),score=123.44 gb/GFBE01048115.1/:1-1995(+)
MTAYLDELAANITAALVKQDHLASGLDRAMAGFNAADQSLLSVVAMLVGACLVARGFAIIKLFMVMSLACGLGVRTATVAQSEGQGAAGAVSALVVTACAIVFAHRMYPLMVFFIGCTIGGVLTFAFRESLGLQSNPAALLSFVIMVSVFGGLAFKHFRIMGWRLLTPLLGGLLAAASLRFWLASIIESGSVTWLDFRRDLMDPETTMLEPSGAVFAVAWGVSAILGWYFQLSTFFGGDDYFALPAKMATWLARVQTFFPFVFDDMFEVSKDQGREMRTFRDASEPFLSEGDDVDAAQAKKDYRPEAVVIISVSSVLILNMFLIGKPLLFLGHVVLMSSAFLPFMTAGLMSYASPNRVLPGLSGTGQQGPLLRHFTHATFNVLVLFCALLGYLCMYWNHALMHRSQIGWSAGNSWNRVLHVWIGYVILGILFLMTFSGAVKMLTGLTGGHSRSVATHHKILGHALYALSAFNMILGYFFRDLLPLWGSVLLTCMLLCVILTTVFFLKARSPETVDKLASFDSTSWRGERWRQTESQEVRPWEKLRLVPDEPAIIERRPTLVSARLESLRSLTRSAAASTVSFGSFQGALGLERRTSFDWEAVLTAFEAHDRIAMLAMRFTEWHRITQAAHISKAQAALQGSSNLVDFLSSALVENRRIVPFQEP